MAEIMILKDIFRGTEAEIMRLVDQVLYATY